MTVADAEDITRQAKVRRSPDIKTDIQLRHLHNRFLTGHAVTDDVQRPESELGEFLNQE